MGNSLCVTQADNHTEKSRAPTSATTDHCARRNFQVSPLAAKVLLNDLILGRITACLSAADLLNLRSTCTVWKHVLTGCLVPRSTELVPVLLTNNCPNNISDYIDTIKTRSFIPFTSYKLQLGPSRKLLACQTFFIQFGGTVHKLVLEPSPDRIDFELICRAVFAWTPNLVDLELIAPHFEFNIAEAIKIPQIKRLRLVLPWGGPSHEILMLRRLALDGLEELVLEAEAVTTSDLEILIAWSNVHKISLRRLEIGTLEPWWHVRGAELTANLLAELLELYQNSLTSLAVTMHRAKDRMVCKLPSFPLLRRLEFYADVEPPNVELEKGSLQLNYPDLRFFGYRFSGGERAETWQTLGHNRVTELYCHPESPLDRPTLHSIFEFYPSMQILHVTLQRPELLVALWGVGPHVHCLRALHVNVAPQARERQRLGLDELLTGILASQVRVLLPDIRAGTVDPVTIAFNKTGPGITDFKNLQQFSLRFEKHSGDSAPRISDLSEFFGFRLKRGAVGIGGSQPEVTWSRRDNQFSHPNFPRKWRLLFGWPVPYSELRRQRANF